MVDALRAEVAGLADRLGRVERTADSIAAAQARSEMAAMDARLAPMTLNGTAPSTAGVPDAIADGAPIMSRLAADSSLGSYVPGRIDPFAGRANILLDPTLEAFYDSTVLGASLTAVGESWEGLRSFTGAGTPSAIIEGHNGDRVAGASGRSSAFASVIFDWDASTGSPVTSHVELQPNVHLAPGSDAPWLVCAVRLGWSVTAFVGDGLTGTARLVIVDGSDVEVATSDPVALEAGEGFVEVSLECALAAPSGLYRPRLVFDVAAASIGGSGVTDSIVVSEWQLHESDTEDPPSFTPAIGSWVPSVVRTLGDIDTPFLGSIGAGTGAALFEVYPDGRMVWYDVISGDVINVFDPRGLQGPFPFVRSLDSDLTRNSTTPSTIFAFPVVSGRVYGFQATLAYDVTNASQCVSLGFRHPGGNAVANVMVETNDTTGAVAYAHANGSVAATDYMGTAATSVTGTARKVATLDGHYRATADGTFSFRYARAGASASPGVTIVEGSMAMIVAGLA